MAGPFGNPNTAVDIPTGGIVAGQPIAKQYAPESPSGIAQAAQLVNAVSPGVNALMGEHYKEQMLTEVKGVEAALAAARRPWSMDSLMSDEAAKDPIVSNAVKELKGMQVAVRRGQMPVDFAVDRMEQIISKAAAKVPAYEEELRAAGRNYLGFDPHQKILSDMMQPTAQERADEADTAAAMRVGMDVDTYRTAKMQMFQIEFAKKQLDYQLAAMNVAAKPGQLAREEASFQMSRGRYQMDVDKYRDYQQDRGITKQGDLVVQHAGLESASLSAQLMQGVQEQIAAGGIQDVEAWKIRNAQAFAALQAAELSKLPPGADASVITRSIDQQRQLTDSLIDMASAGKIKLNENNYIKELYTNKLMKLPKVGAAAAVFGPDHTMELFSLLGRISKTGPGGYESLLTEGGAEGGALIFGELMSPDELMNAGVGEGLAKQAGAFHFGDAQLSSMSEPARRTAVILSGIRMAKPNQPGTEYAGAIGKLKELAGGSLDEYYVTLANPEVVANVSNSKETHAALIANLEDDMAATVQKYVALVSRGDIVNGSIALDGGRVVLPFPGQAEMEAAAPASAPTPTGYYGQTLPTGKPAPYQTQPQQSVEAMRLAQHIERMFKFADTYRGTGVLPASVYGGREQFVTTLMQAGAAVAASKQVQRESDSAFKQQVEGIKAQQAAQPAGVIKFQMVDGKLVRVAQ